MKSDLLLKLADLLETLPREKFYYGSWAGKNWGGKPDMSCGTTACALGWATTIPECGIELVREKLVGGGFSAPFPVVVGQLESKRGIGTLNSGIKAAMHAFGITWEQASYLFIPGSIEDGDSGLSESAGPSTVAAHIRRFVSSGGRIPDPESNEDYDDLVYDEDEGEDEDVT